MALVDSAERSAGASGGRKGKGVDLGIVDGLGGVGGIHDGVGAAVADLAHIDRMMLPGRALVLSGPRHVAGRVEILFPIMPESHSIGQLTELLAMPEQPASRASGSPLVTLRGLKPIE